jgi:hypothetical protein
MVGLESLSVLILVCSYGVKTNMRDGRLRLKALPLYKMVNGDLSICFRHERDLICRLIVVGDACDFSHSGHVVTHGIQCRDVGS